MSKELVSSSEFLFDPGKASNLHKVCVSLSKSNLVPFAIRNKPDDLFLIVSMAFELDIPPVQAINTISVIQGKPVIPPQLMIGLVRKKLKGAIIKFDIDNNRKTVSCKTARSMEEFKEGFSYDAQWDVSRCQAMGLMTKDNYKKQLMNMMKWRACAESCRVTFADVVMGLYVDLEFQDTDGKLVPPSSPADLIVNIDEEHPIPAEDLEIGPNYKIQNGKFRGKRFGEIPEDELAVYLDYLKERIDNKNAPKWYEDLYSAIYSYLSEMMKEEQTMEIFENGQ